MVDDVSDLFRRACRVKPNANATGHDRPDVADGPLRHVPHQDANRPTGFQSMRQQRRGKFESLLLEALPRYSPPPIVGTKIENILRFGILYTIRE
jgi:hypothetical protein